MFPIQFRYLPDAPGEWFVLLVNKECVSLYVYPFELALLWPWVRA